MLAGKALSKFMKSAREMVQDLDTNKVLINGKWRSMEERIEYALQITPNDPAILVPAADYYLEQYKYGDNDAPWMKARTYLVKALESRNDGETRWALGNLYEVGNLHDSAAEQYSMAVKLEPQNQEYRTKLAHFHLKNVGELGEDQAQEIIKQLHGEKK